MAYARKRRRRRNPEVAVRKVVTVKRHVVSGGSWFGSTEGKVMLIGGVALVGVLAYVFLSGSS